jgi:hypothetical protein
VCVPALFVLGHDVRRLTWEGGVTGTVKGDVARTVLQRSLALQVHLLGDWECRAEYTRTLSVALLQWQPWMTTLPGCCFVEESCEALLSRMVGRCRANRTLVDFDDILRLFVTLPAPGADPRGTTGAVRQPLVTLFLRRLQRVLANPDSQPYAALLSAKEAQWQALLPASFALPQAPPPATEGRDLNTVLRGALVSLSAAAPVTDDVRAFAAANFPTMHDENALAGRQGAHQRLRAWAAERRDHQRQARSTASAALPPASAPAAAVICTTPWTRTCASCRPKRQPSRGLGCRLPVRAARRGGRPLRGVPQLRGHGLPGQPRGPRRGRTATVGRRGPGGLAARRHVTVPHRCVRVQGRQPAFRAHHGS